MKSILDLKVSEGSCYIGDNFISPDCKAKYTRCEIPEVLAVAMVRTVKPKPIAIGTSPERPIINKEYICVAVNHSFYGNELVFVYLHDFTYYVYIVTRKE